LALSLHTQQFSWIAGNRLDETNGPIRLIMVERNIINTININVSNVCRQSTVSGDGSPFKYLFKH
jgi:hypothetical protein